MSILGWNNSSVERTFSFVTNILSDKRLSISHDTLENSVIVSGNNSIWSEKEREEMIDRALEIYRQQMQNHHNFLWSRLGHEIDDENDEDDLDSEDERLVDELMLFNVDNDTRRISEFWYWFFKTFCK